MAGAIQVQYTTSGLTLYAIIRNYIGSVWNGSTFVSYSTGSLSSYAVLMTEQGSASRYYSVNFPAGITAAGRYAVTIFQRVGGSPAETDTVVSGGSIDFNGVDVCGSGDGGVKVIGGQSLGTSVGYNFNTFWDNGNSEPDYILDNLVGAPTSVWSVATRTLTAGTNIVLAKGTGITGFNDIAATAIVSGGAITTSGGAVSTVSTVNALAANSVNASALATDAVTEITGGIWNAATSSYTVSGSFGEAVGTGLSPAGVWSYPTRTITGGVSLDMTQAWPSSPVSGTVGQAFNFVGNRLDEAISSVAVDAATSAEVAAVQSDIDSLLTRLTSTRAGYLDNLSSGIPTTTEVADEVWGTNISAYATAGEAGTYVKNGSTASALSTAQTSLTTLTDRLTSTRAGYLDNLDPINTNVTTLTSRLTSTRAGYLDNLVNIATAPPSASTIGTAVWNTDISGVSTNGYAGKYLNSGIPTVAAIWANPTRTLTSGANIVLAKGTGITGFNDIAATAIVSGGAITTSAGAVSNVTTVATTTNLTNNNDKSGYSLSSSQSFNLTGNITGNLSGSVGSVTAGVALTSGERNSIATALLDLANGVENSITVRQALRAIASGVLGEVSGAGTGTETFRALGNDGTTRAVVETTPEGDRTSVTLTL